MGLGSSNTAGGSANTHSIPYELVVYKSSPLLEKNHHAHIPPVLLCCQDRLTRAPETILQTSESKQLGQSGYTGASGGNLWRWQLWAEKLVPARAALLPARRAITAAGCSQRSQPTRLPRLCRRQPPPAVSRAPLRSGELTSGLLPNYSLAGRAGIHLLQAQDGRAGFVLSWTPEKNILSFLVTVKVCVGFPVPLTYPWPTNEPAQQHTNS